MGSSMSRRTTPPRGRSTIPTVPLEVSTRARIWRYDNPFDANRITSRRSSGVTLRYFFLWLIPTSQIGLEPHMPTHALRGPLETASLWRKKPSKASLPAPVEVR